MISELRVQSSKKYDAIDITMNVARLVKNVKEGKALIYVPHATTAITINESHDPNVCIDILAALDRMVPAGRWLHDKIDNNGAAHIKAAIIGPSEFVPIKDGKLMLGMWQSIMLLDFDGPKERRVIVEV